MRPRIKLAGQVMAKEKGRVNELEESCIYVSLQDGPAVECVIDTGFNGWLSFPQKLVEDLQLPIIGRERIILLGKRGGLCPIAAAKIVWLEKSFNVNVIVNNGDDVLLGTELLADSILHINYRNKRLTINRLESKQYYDAIHQTRLRRHHRRLRRRGRHCRARAGQQRFERPAARNRAEVGSQHDLSHRTQLAL